MLGAAIRQRSGGLKAHLISPWMTASGFRSSQKICKQIEALLNSSKILHRRLIEISEDRTLSPESQQAYELYLNSSKRRCFKDSSLQVGVRLEIMVMLDIHRQNWSHRHLTNLACSTSYLWIKFASSYFILRNRFRKISVLVRLIVRIRKPLFEPTEQLFSLISVLFINYLVFLFNHSILRIFPSY